MLVRATPSFGASMLRAAAQAAARAHARSHSRAAACIAGAVPRSSRGLSTTGAATPVGVGMDQGKEQQGKDAQQQSETQDAAAADSQGPPRGKASRLLNNFLHGNKEMQSVQQEVDQAHSKLLARGQTVTEIAFHRIKPPAVDEYLEHGVELYRKLHQGDGIKHYGSFISEIGMLDMAVHITTFDNYHVYDEWRARIDRNQERKLLKCLRSRTSHICREFSFWDAHVVNLDGIYELRSYTLKPGSLLEWGTHWKKGVEARRQFCHPVSAWFSQLGELNTVHHLWYYEDLQSRRIARENAWKVKGWSETVFQTVPLVQNIHANVLRRIPLPKDSD